MYNETEIIIKYCNPSGKIIEILCKWKEGVKLIE